MRPFTLLFALFILIFCLSLKSKKTFTISEKGFEDFKIGQTSIKYVNRKFLFSKRKSSLGPFLCIGRGEYIRRTHYEAIIAKKQGITFSFVSHEGDKKSIRYLSAISFYKPFNGITDKGIILNKSTLKEVEEKYGMQATVHLHGKATKSYNKIEFISEILPGQDSLDENLIIKEIFIRKD
jgi:hypothetical protein